MSTDRALETLTAEDFRGQQGTRFLLTDGAGVSYPAELAAVTESAAGAAGASRTPFSVLFQGPLTPVLPQGIYRIEHDQLGSLELFIVPVGPVPPSPGQAPATMGYEAVFG